MHPKTGLVELGDPQSWVTPNRFSQPPVPTIGDALGERQRLLLRAAAGGIVPGLEAACRLKIKPGTLRVWTHRGKITTAAYLVDQDGQRVAWYRLSDVIALAESIGVDWSTWG